MRRLRSLARTLAHDEGGVTIVEFALILLPLLTVVIGGLDLGYQSYVRSVIQGATNDAARRASVQNPKLNTSGTDASEQVKNMIRDQAGQVAYDADITVTQHSFYQFSSIGKAEPLMTDVNGNGRFDADDGDCWRDENNNGTYDLNTSAGTDGRGSPDDVVFYRVDAKVPRLFNSGWLWGGGDTFEVVVESAVRNQPFGERAKPPVLCGTAKSTAPDPGKSICSIGVGLGNVGVCIKPGGVGVKVGP